ncbi:cytochrome P450 [Streptomyces eurocidicus]|nr:cytochrome P450 [Streptomyces eurocidicus]
MPTVRTHPFDPPPGLAPEHGTSPVRRLAYPDGHIGWLVTGHRLTRTVLADPRFSARAEFKRAPAPRPGVEPFIGGPALPGWFVDMDPPDHSRFRRLLVRHFTRRRTEALRPRIEEITAQRLDAMVEAGPPADLVESFALPIPTLTICELLGIPYAERAEFQRNSTALFSLRSTAEQSATALKSLDALLLDLIRHKRRRPADDLLSELSDSDLTEEEAVGVGVLLLTAGHETVASMLGLGTFALLSHPAQLDAVRQGRVDMSDAVEELLRYLTIFQFGVPRTALVDVEVEGRLIRAGESVTLCLPAANRDPDRFDRPDELDVSRAPGGHLAFGHGMHQCIGQHLARVEMQVAYAALVRRFPRLRLAVPAHDVPLGTDMGFYGVHSLPVAW